VTETAVAVDVLPFDWREQVGELAEQRDAVILAHNYQLPEIQDVADHVGDSLGLSRVAAAAEASTIVFCGVHFMAETAKILSYDKTVLIPDERAGCSLADTITAEQLRAWKAEHPGSVVVSYVNTTAAVKAETDVCCTSSNAVDVVRSVPADTAVLFCPDQFLGAHVQRLTGRRTEGTGRRGSRRRAVHPSRVRLRHQRPLPRRRRRCARDANAHLVDERDGRGRAPDDGLEGARRDRDRDAPPADQGQPADAV
jgi:quinolinate synthase